MRSMTCASASTAARPPREPIQHHIRTEEPHHAHFCVTAAPISLIARWSSPMGLGVDSTAMLIEFVNRGIKPDLILFADTGG